MRSLIRFFVIKLINYAFRPSEGKLGLSLEKSASSTRLCIVNEVGLEAVKINLTNRSLEFSVHSNVSITVNGSLLTEVRGSHLDWVSGQKAISCETLNLQDGELRSHPRNLEDVSEVLRRRAENLSNNAEKLIENLTSEQCQPFCSHASDLQNK